MYLLVWYLDLSMIHNNLNQTLYKYKTIVILSWTTLRGIFIYVPNNEWKGGLSHSKTCEDNVIEVLPC